MNTIHAENTMNFINFEKLTISPSKIICIGRNYVDHIAELGNEMPDEMVVFLKPNYAIASQLQSFHQEPLHYEAELCFLYQQKNKQQTSHQQTSHRQDFHPQGRFTAVNV